MSVPVTTSLLPTRDRRPTLLASPPGLDPVPLSGGHDGTGLRLGRQPRHRSGRRPQVMEAADLLIVEDFKYARRRGACVDVVVPFQGSMRPTAP